MSRAARVQLIVGALLVVAAIVFAALPKDWLEDRFGIEPDGGHGAVELLFFLVPAVVGLVLIGRAVLSRRRATDLALPSTDKPS